MFPHFWLVGWTRMQSDFQAFGDYINGFTIWYRLSYLWSCPAFKIKVALQVTEKQLKQTWVVWIFRRMYPKIEWCIIIVPSDSYNFMDFPHSNAWLLTWGLTSRDSRPGLGFPPTKDGRARVSRREASALASERLGLMKPLWVEPWWRNHLHGKSWGMVNLKTNALLTLVGLWGIVWLVEFRHQVMYDIYIYI